MQSVPTTPPLLMAIHPASGMGNQLFMVAALMHFAKKHGYHPVFWDRCQEQWEHHHSVFDIHAMLAHIRIITETERTSLDWTTTHFGESFTFISPPELPNTHIKLVGYFQAHAYVPRDFPTVPAPPRLATELIGTPWHRTFFLHVRRGDYLHPANAHHNVQLTEYWRTCLSEMSVGLTCFVVSDDMEWCQQHLINEIGAALCERFKWTWCPNTCSDVETFFWMTLCDAGGICANSTFSWWAAWYLKQRCGTTSVFMPRVWGLPPLPPAQDLHPPWAKQR